MRNYNKTLFFNRSSFENLLSMKDYINAVEKAHRLHGENKTIETNLVHANAPNGEYHIKTGGLLGENAYYGLKANGGFFNNKQQYGLPNILGIIYLSDASTAYPLAIFESSLISKMRTAAATAIAAKYLKLEGPIQLGIIGYGNQADAHIEALMYVSNVISIKIAGRNKSKLLEFSNKISKKVDIPVSVDSIQNTCEKSNMIVTCTPSTEFFIKEKWIQKGTFIGAIGADSPGKNELDPNIILNSKVVADIKDQVIKVGESQHAIRQKLITPEDIYCELGDLITGKSEGRTSREEIFVYDSTGTAIQDIATAAYIYEKLKDNNSIQSINLFE